MIMEYLPIVSKLFSDKAIVEPEKGKRTYKIVLEEENENASLKQVTIEEIPETCRAIKLDKSRPSGGFLKGKEGELKRCDFVLYINLGKELYRYYIELKSSRPKKQKKREVQKQLKASVSLMKYCEILADDFHQDESLRIDRRNERFVLYRKGNIKRATAFKPYDWKNNSYDEYYEIIVADEFATTNLAKLLADKQQGPLTQAHEREREEEL